VSGAVHVPDHVRIHPAELAGTVRVPGDKSGSHRALLLGALVGTPVRVTGVAPSGDVASTAACLRTLGATIDLAADPATGQLAGTVSGPLLEATDVLDCGNSGTTLRLLCGVVAGIDGLTVLTGDGSLRRRPVDRVAVPLRAMGARIDARAGGRLAPVTVRGGALVGTTWRQPVASAQVKSAILLAGLAADGETTVVSPLVSRDHTERLLAHLGADVTVVVAEDGTETVTVRSGPLVGDTIDVVGDPSSAAFWHVAAAIGSGAVTTTRVGTNPTRTGALDVLRQLGAPVDVAAAGQGTGEPHGDVTVHPSDLAGGLVLGGRTVVDAIDELPVLALAGAISRDGLEVVDAAELRVKESDRVATVAAALGSLGVEVEPRPDGYRVAGGQRPGPGRVDARGDHRIAMTAAIAATVASGPVEITGFAAVATSYPEFLSHLTALGGRVDVLDAPTDAAAPAAGQAHP
jgi:3-phosphoshikimate 1-carboxyvinyltransferase